MLLILEVFEQVVEYLVIAVQDRGIGEVNCYLFLFRRLDVAAICFHFSPQRKPLFLFGLYNLGPSHGFVHKRRALIGPLEIFTIYVILLLGNNGIHYLHQLLNRALIFGFVGHRLFTTDAPLML